MVVASVAGCAPACTHGLRPSAGTIISVSMCTQCEPAGAKACRDGQSCTQCRGSSPWTAPFIVRLLGEYVIEIVESIFGALATGEARSPLVTICGHFAGHNPDFVALTRQQAASYWDCYHRRLYPRLRLPGIVALDAVASAATCGHQTASRGEVQSERVVEAVHERP